MNKEQQMKGTATFDEHGNFFFKPYHPTPEKKPSTRLVATSRYGSLRLGKHKGAARLAFDLDSIPPYEIWLDEITDIYNALVIHLARQRI